jgi:hypothetical protein
MKDTGSLTLTFRTSGYRLGIKFLPLLETETTKTTLILINRHYFTSPDFFRIQFTVFFPLRANLKLKPPLIRRVESKQSVTETGHSCIINHVTEASDLFGAWCGIYNMFPQFL